MPMERFGSFRAFEGDGSGWVSGCRRLVLSVASSVLPARKTVHDDDDGAGACRRPVGRKQRTGCLDPDSGRRCLGDCCFNCRRATLPSTTPPLLLFALQQSKTSPLHHPVCKPRAPAIRVARCPTDGVYRL